jgi:hypothetical protein
MAGQPPSAQTCTEDPYSAVACPTPGSLDVNDPTKVHAPSCPRDYIPCQTSCLPVEHPSCLHACLASISAMHLVEQWTPGAGVWWDRCLPNYRRPLCMLSRICRSCLWQLRSRSCARSRTVPVQFIHSRPFVELIATTSGHRRFSTCQRRAQCTVVGLHGRSCECQRSTSCSHCLFLDLATRCTPPQILSRDFHTLHD